MDKPDDILDEASELLYAVEAMPSDGNISIIAKAILKAKNDALEQAANLIAIDATNATSDDAEIALYKAAHAIRNLKHEG